MLHSRSSRGHQLFSGLLLTSLLLLLACGPSAPPASEPEPAQQSATAMPSATAAPTTPFSPGGLATTATPLPQVTRRLGVLNVAQIGNPVSLTCSERSATDEYDIISHFMEPVFQFNQQAQLEGVVAESFEMLSPAE